MDNVLTPYQFFKGLRNDPKTLPYDQTTVRIGARY